MDEKHIEEVIDLYAADRMTPDQRAAFEERMRRDPELAREVELTLHIVNAVERCGERDALEDLARIGSAGELKRMLGQTKRLTAQKPVKRNILRRLIPFAAAALILGFVWAGMRPEYASEELYERWYETPEYAPAISRGGGEIDAELDFLLDSAAMYYAAGDWGKAIAAYDRGRELRQEYPDYARFYRAAALAAAGREEAVAEFGLLADDTDSDYAAEASWQLVLEYLRLGDRTQAKRQLEALIAKEDAYADDARRLLGELNARKWF